MSRSFKKYFGFTEKSSKKDKRLASKKVRKDWRIGNGTNYKKVYNSCNIKDWRFIMFNTSDFFNFLEKGGSVHKAVFK